MKTTRWLLFRKFDDIRKILEITREMVIYVIENYVKDAKLRMMATKLRDLLNGVFGRGTV